MNRILDTIYLSENYHVTIEETFRHLFYRIRNLKSPNEFTVGPSLKEVIEEAKVGKEEKDRMRQRLFSKKPADDTAKDS